ncbi:hypothetical protein BG005_001774 [Podila minutissima]|nr:hypothetical protein BG005_001774 [Podila minutissima]
MSKEQDHEGTKAMDANQDVQPPPPSYATTSAGNTAYSPPAGAPLPNPGDAYYQAQPIGGQTAPPGGYAPPSGYPPQSVYAAPGGAPGGYAAPAGAPGGYAAPAGAPGGYGPPAGVHPNTVIYVVDNDPVTGRPANPGCPMAMICFIFGLCTWVGYLFGMCFMNSPDPRERLWARACAIMAIIWALIIIFCSIFAR